MSILKSPKLSVTVTWTWAPSVPVYRSPTLAFTGVVIGILITQHPLSLFALYGIVALAGIAVNSAIVLISTANAKLASGMSLLHSTVYAARRRVIPIVITTLTTIGGLISLATGLGGESLIWGPVATAIVSGLAFSSLLTLFAIPLLYRLFMGRRLRGGRWWRRRLGSRRCLCLLLVMCWTMGSRHRGVGLGIRRFM